MRSEKEIREAIKSVSQDLREWVKDKEWGAAQCLQCYIDALKWVLEEE